MLSITNPPTMRGDTPGFSAVKRTLLGALVGALAVAALLAIGILLRGRFGETEGRILLTVLAMVTYSLTGLAGADLVARGRAAWLGMLGVALSGVGFLTAATLIWGDLSWDLFRAAWSAGVLAVAAAHATVLVPRREEGDGKVVTVVLNATFGLIALLAGMLVSVILAEGDVGEGFFRLLGVVAVLDVLGTLLVPILRRAMDGGRDADAG